MQPLPLADLDRLRRLEPASVDRFYRDHAASVLGWVIRLGGPRIDAEDTAHQVFEVALNRLPSFRGESSLRTWLYGVTRRVVANARRRSSLWAWVGLEAWMGADPGPGPEDLLHAHAQRKLVQQALEALPFAQREVVVLVDIEERPAGEVADMLGIPVGTVYSRVHGARRAFGDALKRHGVTRESVLSWGTP
jgi:RNA polymerase sigma-70 factor (ECF subfamily)